MSNLQELFNKTLKLEREIRDNACDDKYYEPNITIFEWCLGCTDFIQPESVESALQAYKRAWEGDNIDYQDGLLVSKHLLSDYDNGTISFEERIDPVPWEDYDEENLYMVVKADVFETDEQFDQRKKASEEKVKLLEIELTEAKQQLKALL